MLKIYQVFAVILIVTLTACNGSKSLSKQGLKLDQAGMYEEAAALHYDALKKNRNNVEARIGLKKNGQIVLDKKLSNFYKAYNLSYSKDAIVAYKDAELYLNNVRNLGVNLDWPVHYGQYYKELVDKYLADQYIHGKEKMASGDYNQAQNYFREISNYNSNYKDVPELINVSVLEPLYINAGRAMNAGSYKQAFQLYDKIFKQQASYKETVKLRQICLEKSVLSLGVFPVVNKSGNSLVSEKIYAFSLSGLVDHNNPLLRVIDRENLSALLAEQRLGMSGIVNEATAAKAGKLIGLKAVLLLNLIEVKNEREKYTQITREAFETWTERVYDTQTQTYINVTKYKKVYYTEHCGNTGVTVSVHYQLISTETGEVLVSDVVQLNKKDEITYNIYAGDHNKLLPSDRGTVNYAGALNWRKTFTQRPALKSSEELSIDICKQIGFDISRAILSYAGRP